MEPRHSFNDLPTEIIYDHILRHINLKQTAKFFITCQQQYNQVPSLQTRKHLLSQLLEYILHGQQLAADELLQRYIKIHPQLLTDEGHATDYSGRVIYGTALEMALGAEDVRLHDNDICMVEMIKYHFQYIENGIVKLHDQLNQFFSCVTSQIEKMKNKDSTAIKLLFDTIEKANNISDCEPAMLDFHNHLLPRKTIRGIHFNHDLMLDAYSLYAQHYSAFLHSYAWKNELIWQKVIGHIQRYLPACYMQALNQGLYFVTHGDKLVRDLTVHYGNESIFPLDQHQGLGFNFALHDSFNKQGFPSYPSPTPPHLQDLKVLVDFIKQKQQRLDELQAAAQNYRLCMSSIKAKL